MDVSERQGIHAIAHGMWHGATMCGVYIHTYHYIAHDATCTARHRLPSSTRWAPVTPYSPRPVSNIVLSDCSHNAGCTSHALYLTLSNAQALHGRQRDAATPPCLHTLGADAHSWQRQASQPVSWRCVLASRNSVQAGKQPRQLAPDLP